MAKHEGCPLTWGSPFSATAEGEAISSICRQECLEGYMPASTHIFEDPREQLNAHILGLRTFSIRGENGYFFGRFFMCELVKRRLPTWMRGSEEQAN